MLTYRNGKMVRAQTLEGETVVEYYYASPYYYKRTYHTDNIMKCIDDTLGFYEKEKHQLDKAKHLQSAKWKIAHGGPF